MKILSVIEAFCHGGAQTVLLDTVLALREHQHRVVHFSRANGIATAPAFVEQLGAAGIECLDTHWEAIRDNAPRSQLLADFQPDVVMFHWWGKDPWMPWIRSRRPDAPKFVCVMHHAVYPAQAGYDRYVLVSRSQLPQVAHLEPRRIELIPNGVDLSRFQRRCERRIDPGRPFIIGRLSELREGKIPADWIETVASFDLDRTRFVIAGTGALLPKLRESAVALGMEEKVSFPGYIARDAVPALLENFDAFCYVTSSAEECCPLAILEAMAAGVPVVAQPRGGMTEIVVDGENGLLANSMDQIGNHLRRLRDDIALRDRLAAGARATAERFSFEKQIAQYRDLLSNLDNASMRAQYRVPEVAMEKT